MIIKRLETVDGFGPYRLQFDEILYMLEEGEVSEIPSFIEGGGYSNDRHPSTSMSGLGYITHRDHFGFGTDEDMLSWFFPLGEHDAALLEEFGYMVREYHIPEGAYRLGIKQAVFKKEKATLGRSILPTEYYKEVAL